MTALKDKVNEISKVVKTLETFTEKNPDFQADLDVIVSFEGLVYARIFDNGNGLEMETF